MRTINEHVVNIYNEGELSRAATIRKFRIVRSEGKREVTREVEHYNPDAILAVGFRVRSHRGTQFRQWAVGRLNEYLVKGFTMDDERLKNPPGQGQKDYFDEQLERIRDIRSSTAASAAPPSIAEPLARASTKKPARWRISLVVQLLRSGHLTPRACR
ncbi:MAG: RhuM family protein [Opitutaceae bacterium]